MTLLQLPVELFDPIMRRAIDPLSIEKAVQLRSVCSKSPCLPVSIELTMHLSETFDRWILNSLLSMHEGFGQQLVQDCIVYNNAKMVYSACVYRSRGSYTTLEHGKLSGLWINKFDEFQIPKYGRAAFLEALIGYGFFDPKKNTLKGCYGEH
jgi:hypothetical protein